MSNQPKQLKKSDFLAAVTEAPMTRGQLVDALVDFEYISTYMDYLVEHFQAQGKIIVEGDFGSLGDGTIRRKGRKTSGPRNVFRVVEREVHNGEIGVAYVLESKEITGNLSDEDKEAGWSMTEKAAVKKASSDVFADYKTRTAAIKATLEADESAEDEAE